ncbi:MAG: cytochrome c [Pseudobdellovibrionaceae bacterium]|nr:cytochrome c [Pseudobdellovibrionaceae bacterium]
MNAKHLTLICGLALALISCDQINKSKRSQGEEAAAVEAPATDADATAGETPGETTADPAADKVDPAMALSGKDLYAKLCASCHQDLDQSTLSRTSLVTLKAAIASVPEMAGLKDTSEKDLEALVAALSTLSPGKGKGKEKAAEKAAEVE